MLVAFSLLALLLPEAAGSDPRQGPRFLEKRDDTRTQRDHQPSIRVDVNLVLVPVTVADPLGRIVTGLEQSDFQVFEDKVPHRIVAFSSEDTPVSIGLVFDVSSSMSDKMAQARSATKVFFETLNPRDEAFLMSFADRPGTLTDFTTDFAAAQNSLLFVKPKGRH